MDRHPHSFYLRDVAEVAKDLLGELVVHETEEGRCVGQIVETEAYYGNHTYDDPACHAHGTRTDRTEVFYGPGGHAYVYVCYGIHMMFNVIAGEEGEAGGVLIRALEPVEGVDIMRERRGVEDDVLLTNGPGKLTEALGIDKELYGHDLREDPFYICKGREVSDEELATSTRIGISVAEDLPLRFYVKGNDFVSRM